jgi:hypothetical protein
MNSDIIDDSFIEFVMQSKTSLVRSRIFVTRDDLSSKGEPPTKEEYQYSLEDRVVTFKDLLGNISVQSITISNADGTLSITDGTGDPENSNFTINSSVHFKFPIVNYKIGYSLRHYNISQLLYGELQERFSFHAGL